MRRVHTPSCVKKSRNVVILLSGGIDSATCLAYYAKKSALITTVYWDIGQPSSEQESQASKTLSAEYRTKHIQLSVNGGDKKLIGEISARNAFMVFGALMETGLRKGTVVLGIHSGARYFDTTTAFTTQMQAIINGYSNGMIQLATPLISMTKMEVFQLAKRLSVPISKTYSCQAGTVPVCGRCDSCLDRRMLNALPNE